MLRILEHEGVVVSDQGYGLVTEPSKIKSDILRVVVDYLINHSPNES
ncbi:MAG: hypothetical protein AABW89_04870 [Nanoarchaeota archaeon]